MNCDQAFECLTDATRSESSDLNRHLDSCPRCRHMQSVLEPALELLAPGDEEAAQRSARECAPQSAALTADSILLAERTAADLAQKARPQRRGGRFTASPLLRYAAVFLLGVGFAFGAAKIGGGQPRGSGGNGATSDCLWLQSTASSENQAPGSRSLSWSRPASVAIGAPRPPNNITASLSTTT